MNDRQYTVTQINAAASNLLKTYHDKVTVVGEISRFNVYSSGHAYFTVKDDKSSLSCVMFQGDLGRVPFKPEIGLEVILTGGLTVYGRSGTFQLTARRMEPVGRGAQDIAREQLRAKLEADGLFSLERKREIPSICRRVAVVTSPVGAVIRDILTVLDRRCGGLDVTIFPARVQGLDSPADIKQAIFDANEAGGYDVIVLARGGGSAEDLAGFNHEWVARAIASSKIPIISAVGHETDITIADEVADLRAATPSQAAEIISGDVAAIRVRLEALRGKLRELEAGLRERRSALRVLEDVLYRSFGKRLDSYRARLVRCQDVLFLSDPTHILKRGYAIVYLDLSVEAIRSKSEAKYDMDLVIKFHDGDVRARVIEGGP